MLRKVFIFVFITVFLSSLVTPLASAADASGFQAGKIIDDSVFTNTNTMSVTDIQNFLNSKVPTCDSNSSASTGGTGTVYNPPFICLKDFYEIPYSTDFSTPPPSYSVSFNYLDTNCTAQTGSRTYLYNNDYKYTSLTPVYTNGDCHQGYTLKATIQNINGVIPDGAVSAAQIIYNTAQYYKINPEVLIVLLQKEQGLITDNSPQPWEYQSATGYGCPDYAPCSSGYSGFSNQVKWAATMFRAILNNSPTWTTPYLLGNNYIQYSPVASCGGSTVDILNRSTQALYNYTPYQPDAAALAAGYGTGDACSSYGNRNFYLYFSDWFGSPTTPVPTQCDSQVADITCVWSMRKTDGSQFLTSSQTELNNGMYEYGWINEGIAFYASSIQSAGTIPVYRLRQTSNNMYYYTADPTEYSTMKSSGSWADEGIAFYALPPATSNSSYEIYKLFDSTTNQYDWVMDGLQKDYLLQNGYQVVSNSFNSFSGTVSSLPTPVAGRDNIYRLRNSTGYFYTTSLAELDAVVKMGYVYEGVLTTANASSTGTPVYRLRYGERYFYTTDSSERDLAISQYGYSYEGIGFYIDSSSDPVYRLANTRSGSYLYTSNINEVMSLTNTNGWTSQGTLMSNSNTSLPVYRFLNQYTNRHFYTIDINEATQITNKGWKYETVAFDANTSTGQPVYRLRLNDKYLYTTDPNEKDIAISKYGYTYEEIAFYASQTATATPVYRLQGGNNEYFYTASSAERDSAVSNYGYTYEGIGFYLP